MDPEGQKVLEDLGIDCSAAIEFRPGLGEWHCAPHVVAMVSGHFTPSASAKPTDGMRAFAIRGQVAVKLFAFLDRSSN